MQIMQGADRSDESGFYVQSLAVEKEQDDESRRKPGIADDSEKPGPHPPGPGSCEDIGHLY